MTSKVSGPVLDQNGAVQPFVSSLPFNYTVDFYVNLRGVTDFRTTNGKICSDNTVSPVGALLGRSRNFYVAAWVDVSGGSDYQATTTIRYVANGTQQGYCWGPGLNVYKNYYLRFTKNNDSLEMKGTGDAHQ